MLNTWSPKATLIMAGVAVVGVWYLKRQAEEAVAEVVDTVDRNFNPTKSTNLANRATQWGWDQVTDGKGTIGTDIYDLDRELTEKYYKYSPVGLYEQLTEWWGE